MRYILFGTGEYYQRYKKWFQHEEIVALTDNSSNKINKIIDGIRVLSPMDAVNKEYDIIVILSFYVSSMKEQLLQLGVDENKIYHFYDLHKISEIREKKFPVNYYKTDSHKSFSFGTTVEKVVLLSHDLSLGGPAIALLHVAEVLVKYGYEVCYASMIDGPLKDIILSKGIPVIVDNNLQVKSMAACDWIDKYDLIFCNTINYHYFLACRDTSKKVIWWLHDSDFFYDGVSKSLLRNIDKTNMKVVSVGPVPKKAFSRYAPNVQVDILLYGVDDTRKIAPEEKKVVCDKVCFVTVGYIESRKGQDILIDAILSMPKIDRQKVVFYLVGQNTSIMAQQISEKIKDTPEIVITGIMDRKGIDRIMEQADVLICPSREDPMPTVAAEAMMHGVMCIVSDITGTADYIQDGINGMLFENENKSQLASKIEWCIHNPNSLKLMGENARKVYENNFSMTVFEENILHYIRRNNNEK